MATTKLSDVIAHDKEFLATVYEKLTTLAVLRTAGVVVSSHELATRANGAGVLTSIPFYKALTQTESVVGSDNDASSITPGKITQGEQIAARHFRNAAWSAMDLTGAMIGDDPMGAIAQRVAEYWAVDEENMVIASLKGVLADDEAGSDVLYVGDGTGAIDPDLVIDAAGTSGDAASVYDTLIIHSAVHRNIQKAQANDFIPKAKTDIGFDLYLNKYKLVVSDNLPLVSGVYTSILASSGAVLVGEGSAKVPLAYARNEAAGDGSGQETLYNRRQFVLHVNGMKWDAGSVAGKSPTNAELANAANWSQSYLRKNIGIAFIKSNG